MSLRARLTLAVAAVLVATLVLSGAVLVRSTSDALVGRVDEDLAGFAGRMSHGPAEREPASGQPPGSAGSGYAFRPYARLVYSAGGDLLIEERSGYQDDPAPLPDVPPLPSDAAAALVGRIVTVPAVEGDLDYRLLTRRDPDGTITMVGAPLREVDATIDQLARRLLLIGAVALIVATAACWWLIRRGLRPVDRMVETATAIAAGDMSRRVPDADPETELGRLGRALNEMLHQIEGALRARAASEDRLRRFVADAAHELRTPLTSLRGYAELYRQGALPDDASVAAAMGQIESEGARMARLVEDLLLLARLDQQRGLELEPVEIGGVVEDAIAAFRAAQPGWPITQALDDGLVVRGDRLRLRQVLDNLLANVRMHTPPNTPVEVSVRREGDRAVVAVADRGPGIATEDRDRIFDRFWRGGSPRLRSHGGTGLGLAIVASLVEAHGGTIEVASDPGAGTTFITRLPLADA
jgi:two-component system OmpR family sensor kinase